MRREPTSYTWRGSRVPMTPTDRSSAVGVGRGEPLRIAPIRWCLQNWPLRRGRGLLLKLASPLLRDRPFVYRLEPGVVVRGELEEHQFLYYFAHGLSKDPSFRLARRIVRPRDTVIDVGANVGFWLMGVARRAGAEAAIHAFEPFPANCVRLQEHLELNRLAWVRCHPAAVGATLGASGFIGPGDANRGLGSLTPSGAASGLNVPVTTLDAFCREGSLPRVDLLKVDVEGAELLVFRGAQGLLASREAPIIMFEVGDTLAARFGATSAEVKSFLEASGYFIFRFDGMKLRRVQAPAEHQASEDLFALQPTHFRERPLLRDLLA